MYAYVPKPLDACLLAARRGERCHRLRKNILTAELTVTGPLIPREQIEYYLGLSNEI
jgi:hypothetical protein